MQGPLPIGPWSFTVLMTNGAALRKHQIALLCFHTKVNLTKQEGVSEQRVQHETWR